MLDREVPLYQYMKALVIVKVDYSYLHVHVQKANDVILCLTFWKRSLIPHPEKYLTKELCIGIV